MLIMIAQTPIRQANEHNQSVNDTQTQANEVGNNSIRLITKLKPPQQPKKRQQRTVYWKFISQKLVMNVPWTDLVVAPCPFGRL